MLLGTASGHQKLFLTSKAVRQSMQPLTGCQVACLSYQKDGATTWRIPSQTKTPSTIPPVPATTKRNITDRRATPIGGRHVPAEHQRPINGRRVDLRQGGNFFKLFTYSLSPWAGDLEVPLPGPGPITGRGRVEEVGCFVL